MKVRHITRRDRWRLTTHLRGLYGTVSLQSGPFWMVRMVKDYQPRERVGRKKSIRSILRGTGR